MIHLIESFLQLYNLSGKRTKFSIHMTYILSELNTGSVEGFSWDSHAEMIMLSTFITFELRFHYKTIDVEMMTVFTEKWDKCAWELNLFGIVKMIELLWWHCDVWWI